MPRIFDDRQDAGRQLGAALRALPVDQPVVLALPRGGVPVAAEVARALKAPLDLVMVHKIGAPMLFGAVGEHYRRFDQTTDAEVIELMEAA